MRSLLVTILFLGACGNTTQVNSGAVSKQKASATMAKGYAKKTPPSGGHSMGMMSQPKAGNTTIPITNVEVYVFTANIDDDATGETLYWAYDGQTAYVWGQIDLVCVDDDDVETGETGTADFILEDNGETWGWMVATDSCGYSTLYGCNDDGSGEVCGGCDWDDSLIVCTAEG